MVTFRYGLVTLRVKQLSAVSLEPLGAGARPSPRSAVPASSRPASTEFSASEDRREAVWLTPVKSPCRHAYPMPELIATIFHVTDMHLFVDVSGVLREDRPLRSARLLSAVAEKVPVPSVRALFSGAMWHNEEALAALRQDLPETVLREREEAPVGTPILVLQTGDVEALGSAAPAEVDGYDAFPSFAFLHQELRTATGADFWSDIYGNHDTWPGTYPAMRWRHRAINRARIASVPGIEGPWPDLVEAGIGPTGIPVVVARVNTVSRTLLEETLASGIVCDHPPQDITRDAVIDDVAAQFAPWQGRPAVRIVALHHPPHPFETTLGQELTTGWLEGGAELAQRLSQLGVQLVIAGHRHKLDPPRDAPEAPASQPPLRPPTVQLVAESPTQDSVRPVDDNTEYDALEGLSFCRYRLWANGTTFAVERTIFNYSEIGGAVFSPEISATLLFEGIPFE
jgi:hypothetical protein